MDIDTWVKLAKIVGGFGNLLLGLIATILTICAAARKGKDFFRNKLSNMQIDELARLRNVLQDTWYNGYYSHYTASLMEGNNLSIEEIKNRMPQQWEEYQAFRFGCLDIFYKFSSPDYYLFPKDMPKQKIIENSFET